MEIVDRRIPLSQIGKTVGPSPVTRFVDSVRRHGVVVPVLLREVISVEGELQFAIVDGNRRVAAARLLGHAEVPARLLADISADDAARLTLLGNNFRSANDITEFWAIKHLERSGVPRKRIADDAGFSEQYLDIRNRWSRLDRRIFVGFAEGRIAASVANKISRLSPGEQRELGDLFASKGQVLTVDVERVAKPRTRARRPSANDVPSVPVYEPVARVDPPVTILSVPVDPSVRTPSPCTADPSDELRQALQSAARVAVAEGVSLGGLSHLLSMAYREAMSAMDVAGEQGSGRDHQS